MNGRAERARRVAIADQGAVLDSGRVALARAGSQLLDDPKGVELYLGGAPPDAGASACRQADEEAAALLGGFGFDVAVDAAGESAGE